MLGNGRVEAQCFDGVKRLALIRGKLRKKVWINQGDIVLLSLREFQDEKADVIQRYNPDEARQLKAYGELPDTAKINEADANFGGEEDDEVEFDFDIDEVSWTYSHHDSVDSLPLLFFNRFKINRNHSSKTENKERGLKNQYTFHLVVFFCVLRIFG